MKTKKTIFAGITITTLLREFVLMILFSLALSAFGQRIKENEQNSFGNENVDEYELTSFKCKYREGKIYIMWTVLEPLEECIYRLERSADDKTYNTVYAIKGARSPKNIELLNSFIDKEPLTDKSYYRIRRFTKEESMLSSPFIINGFTMLANQ